MNSVEEAVQSLRADVALGCIRPGWNDSLIIVLI